MQSIWRIISSTHVLWRHYVAISFFTVTLSIVNLLQPMLSGWAIDEIRKGTQTNIRYVVWIAIGLFAIDFGGNILSNVGGYIGDQMSAKLNKLLSTRYYEHMLSLPQRYFDTELSGTIINRLSRSINQISNFMNMLSNNFLQFLFSTVFALIIVARYSWVVALLLLALYPIYVLMTIKTSNIWGNYQAQKNLNLDIASGRFAEAIGQVKVVQSFNQEERELNFFARRLGKMVSINQPQSKFWHTQDVRRRIVLNVIFFAVYLYIFVGAAHGIFTPGQAVALILYAMQIRIPIFTISFLVENTQKAMADSKDYFEALEIEPEIADKPGAARLLVSTAAIMFRDVWFGYSYDHMVLKGITLAIKPGTKVALVGESGEGKTTITNILMRLYEPQKGSVEIDGQDIAEVTQESLRSQIGVVFQDPALFSGTVLENIAYANPKASEQDVIAAAQSANAHEFISKFEKGYQTEIGERGLKLSGGQKQRIAIARALLKNAPILILDEATSSLDSKSEHMVQEALERLMRGRTTIIVAHRLSTIQHVDTIVTLKDGQIDETGSPHELASSGGIYSQLLRLQSQAGTDKEKIKKSLHKFDIETV